MACSVRCCAAGGGGGGGTCEPVLVMLTTEVGSQGATGATGATGPDAVAAYDTATFNGTFDASGNYALALAAPKPWLIQSEPGVFWLKAGVQFVHVTISVPEDSTPFGAVLAYFVESTFNGAEGGSLLGPVTVLNETNLDDANFVPIYRVANSVALCTAEDNVVQLVVAIDPPSADASIQIIFVRLKDG